MWEIMPVRNSVGNTAGNDAGTYAGNCWDIMLDIRLEIMLGIIRYCWNNARKTMLRLQLRNQFGSSLVF